MGDLTFAEWSYEVDRQLRVKTKKSLLDYTQILLKSEVGDPDTAFTKGLTPEEYVCSIIGYLGLTDFTC